MDQATTNSTTPRQFVLPSAIVTPMDVSRLLREIEEIDDYFRQAELRKSGSATQIPTNSRLMEVLINNNQLNLLESEHRAALAEFLKMMDQHAPVVHMSFGVDPPGKLTQQLASWLREHIDPRTVITVGLQPNIGAGCVLRTTNKIFDLSLREFFTQKKDVFIDRLHAAIADPEPAAPQREATPIEVRS